MDVSELRWGRRRRLRSALASGAQPSLRGTLFLAFSTFLCGAVMAGLLFVGIWRHTAGEQAQTEAARLHDRRQLLNTQQRLAAVKTQLARSQVALARARRQVNEDADAIRHAQASSRTLTESLSRTLHDLAERGNTLVSETATIESELNALQSYISHPGAAGLDAGYLTAQVRYLLRSADTASTRTAALVRDSRDAATTLSR